MPLGRAPSSPHVGAGNGEGGRVLVRGRLRPVPSGLRPSTAPRQRVPVAQSRRVGASLGQVAGVSVKNHADRVAHWI
jgi:hypothetical protein